MDPLLLTISGPEDADEELLASMALRLAADLREAAGVDAHPHRSGDTVPGSKSGTALSIGALVITGIFSAATMTAISEVLCVWITRRRAGTVTLAKGDLELEVSGLTEQQVQEELAKMVSLFRDDDVA